MGVSKMKIIIILWITFWSEMTSSRAMGSTGTVEESVLNAVSDAIGDYKRTHGRLPTTWEEISTRFDAAEGDSVLKEVYGYRLQERYEFLRQNLPMYGNRGSSYDIDEGSRVIIVRVAPFRDYRAHGMIVRSFIYETKGGDIRRADVTEERARSLAQKYNVTLPVREGVPAIETNESLKVRSGRTYLWAGIATLIFIVACWFSFRSKRSEP